MRLFTAFIPPADLRDALADLDPNVDGLRWVQASQVHLTLRFLGEIENPDAVASALDRVRVPSPELTMNGVTLFPRPTTARILAATVPLTAPLQLCHRAIQAALLSIGVPPEDRTFRPHYTLARVKPRGRAPARRMAKTLKLPEVPSFVPKEIVLMASHPNAEGGRYEPIHRVRLQPAAPAGA